jgi:hypothetical protein
VGFQDPGRSEVLGGDVGQQLPAQRGLPAAGPGQPQPVALGQSQTGLDILPGRSGLGDQLIGPRRTGSEKTARSARVGGSDGRSCFRAEGRPSA